MSAFNYDELKRHVGHKIVCVSYADGANVAVECEDCCEVLLDYDRIEDFTSIDDIGADYVRCNMCMTRMYVDQYTDVCPNCKTDGCLMDIEEDIKEGDNVNL